jgi:hypothetical protein
VLALERDRLRAAAGGLGVAAAATVPMMAGNLSAFHHAWSYISKAQPVVTLFNWLYPFSPNGTGRITDVTGASHPFVGHLAWPVEGVLSHPLIIVVGIALPLLVARRVGAGRAAVPQLLVATALVFLLRCGLDPESAAYYHLPMLLVLVLADAAAGRRLPLVGLVSAAVSFTVLDRFPGYLPAGVANLGYVVVSAVVMALLISRLRARPAPELMRTGGAPITAS